MDSWSSSLRHGREKWGIAQGHNAWSSKEKHQGLNTTFRWLLAAFIMVERLRKDPCPLACDVILDRSQIN